MIKAFVFGKFLPFHKGHEAMIRFALTHCDRLSVLICCSDREAVSAAVRQSWIERTFADEYKIEVESYKYREENLPNTSESSREVAARWSRIFKARYPDHSLVITSEPYGEFVAEWMNIKHLPFDIPRTLQPISATTLRKDPWANWHFLPDPVKPWFVTKVVVLGTESTGKSTLAGALSRHFKATLVPETGRELIPSSNAFSIADLLAVAKAHAVQIERAIVGPSPLVIIDTDIHITNSYARFVFDRDLDVSQEIYRSNAADLHLYLDKNVPFVQDGTRLDQNRRDLLDLSHRRILKEKQIKFAEISGNWEERYLEAVKQINAVRTNKSEPNRKEHHNICK